LTATTNILPASFEWCAIPAGAVTLEGGPQPFTVAAFDMAKYPITNAQFQVFLDADDGYAHAGWWDFSPKAKRWRAQNSPCDTPFPGDDLPRVRVSWYEAAAFCFWLSRKTGQAIALPTEQEWQGAAQGDDGRAYPWGTALDINRCNTSESGIKQPTPVTKYPNGGSPYGVLDMSGNMSEWCVNAFNMPDDAEVGSFAGGEARAVRGGSWGISQFSALVTFRGFNYPADRFEFPVMAFQPSSSAAPPSKS